MTGRYCDTCGYCRVNGDCECHKWRVADYEVSSSNEPRPGLVDLRIDTQVPRETLMLLQGAADLCGLSVGEVVSFWLWEIAKQKSELVTRDADGKYIKRTGL